MRIEMMCDELITILFFLHSIYAGVVFSRLPNIVVQFLETLASIPSACNQLKQMIRNASTKHI